MPLAKKDGHQFITNWKMHSIDIQAWWELVILMQVVNGRLWRKSEMWDKLRDGQDVVEVMRQYFPGKGKVLMGEIVSEDILTDMMG